MNFAACKNRLETQRMMLVGHAPKTMQWVDGAAPRDWRDRMPEPLRHEMLGHFELDDLRQIDVALARLREGSYGICLLCGDLICEAQLDKMPAAPFCQSCSD